MGEQVYDRFSAPVRFVSCLVCVAIGVGLLFALPDAPFLSLIALIPTLLVLMWRNKLVLRFDGRSWTYRRGFWPVAMQSNAGSFADLNVIEIGTHQYQPTDRYGNEIDDAPDYNSYTAYLRFKDPSIPRQALLTGRSFSEAARPGAAMAHRLNIPLTLALGMRGYESQLDGFLTRTADPDSPELGH